MGRYSAEALEKGRLANFAKFVKDANEKFGGRFDYSRVNYVAQKVPVEIVCPDHGQFSQTPTKHLSAKFGCPRCGVDSRAGLRIEGGKDRFIQKFTEKFADTLELLDGYVSVKGRIRLRCKIHGTEFETTPDALKNSKFGCSLCAGESRGVLLRLTQSEFLSRSHSLFGDQFDLSQAVYTDINSTVTIGCPVHGIFAIKPINFLSSRHGCPKCGRLHAGYAAERIRKLEAGLVKARPTTLALMKVEVFGIEAFKLGVTSRKLVDRYSFALREILFEATLDELDALRLEQHLHGKYFKGRDLRIFLAGLRGGQRWPGDSEIYKSDYVPAIMDDLLSAMRAIESRDPTYWESLSKLSAPVLRIRSVRKTPGKFNVARPVVRLDTGEVFPSATAAARAVGSTQGLVSLVCSGKRGETKGVRFAYQDDYAQGTVPRFENKNLGAEHKWARSVRCVDTGVTYSTLRDAAGFAGIDSSKITMVCKGKRKSAGGYRWEYVE